MTYFLCHKKQTKYTTKNLQKFDKLFGPKILLGKFHCLALPMDEVIPLHGPVLLYGVHTWFKMPYP